MPLLEAKTGMCKHRRPRNEVSPPTLEDFVPNPAAAKYMDFATDRGCGTKPLLPSWVQFLHREFEKTS